MCLSSPLATRTALTADFWTKSAFIKFQNYDPLHGKFTFLVVFELFGFWGLGSWQACLMCIGGVSWGRVCGSDCLCWWQVICDRCHVTHCFFFFTFSLLFGIILVLVLLFVHIEGFNVSFKWNLYVYIYILKQRFRIGHHQRGGHYRCARLSVVVVITVGD